MTTPPDSPPGGWGYANEADPQVGFSSTNAAAKPHPECVTKAHIAAVLDAEEAAWCETGNPLVIARVVQAFASLRRSLLGTTEELEPGRLRISPGQIETAAKQQAAVRSTDSWSELGEQR